MITWLERAAAMGFTDYDPGFVIRAVNELQPLGKDAALEAVENQHAAAGQYGLFWILRTLFDMPPDREFPPVRLGKPAVPPPDRPQTLPRFPILLIRDVPLLVVRGYTLGGLPEPVQDHVVHYRAHGRIRDRALTPPSAVDGMVAEVLELWSVAYGDSYAADVVDTITPQLAKVFRALSQ